MGINDGNSDSTLSVYLPGEFQRNRAVTSFDRTHNLQTGVLYELPFGKNKPYLTSGVGAALVGGWQINSVFGSYTGTPYTVTAPGTSLNAPGTTQFADQVASTVNKLGGIDVGHSFFDGTAYRTVTDVRLGTSSLRGLRGPGVINIDLSLFRKFQLTERFNLEFRTESYNFTNTPHFDNPNGTLGSANYTFITSALQDQRVVRFALRLGF